MKIHFSAAIIISIVCPVFAVTQHYLPKQTIGRYYVADNGTIGQVLFGVNGHPEANRDLFLCISANSEQFRFDATTATGKNILATLMLAKSQGAAVDIWYEDAQIITGACGEGQIAIVHKLGIE